jgi:hypothetical protein
VGGRLIPIIVAEARHADRLRARLPSKHGQAEFHTAGKSGMRRIARGEDRIRCMVEASCSSVATFVCCLDSARS